MWFYRALLHLYPSSFRAEYGEEMCAVFEKRRTSLLAATIEVLSNAPAVHWDILRQDLRYTARTLARAPGFTAVAILVLALGIGANTAVFSVTDYVLIRPLPFPSPDRLVSVWETLPGYSHMELSPANYRDWKRMNSAFEDLAAVTTEEVNLIGQGAPERVKGAIVTGNLFAVLGVQPLLGRSITPADDREGAPLTAVLSYGLWQRAFGGDAGVLGRKGGFRRQAVHRNRDHATAVSLPEPGGGVLDTVRVSGDGVRGSQRTIISTESPGSAAVVSIQQASAEMNVIAGAVETPISKGTGASTGHQVDSLRDEISDQRRLLLVALAGAALCVLLIACSNLANLLLARALTRQKELAVRTALGAGRERLIRQLVTESMVLSLLGGLLGIALASAALPLLTKLVPSLPASGVPAIDFRVLGFAAILTALTGIGFGTVPALRAGRGDLTGLRERIALGRRAQGGATVHAHPRGSYALGGSLDLRRSVDASVVESPGGGSRVPQRRSPDAADCASHAEVPRGR